MSDTLDRIYRAMEDAGVASRERLQHLRSKGNPTFADDIGADSLDMVDVYFAVEDEFGIKLADDIDPKTVSDLVTLVDDALREKREAKS